MSSTHLLDECTLQEVKLSHSQLKDPLEKVHIDFHGLKSIDPEILRNLCDPDISKAKNLSDLFVSTKSIRQKLLNTKCISRVNIAVDAVNSREPILNLNLEEIQRDISINTTFDHKGCLALGISLCTPNLLGRLHTMTIGGKFSGLSSRNFHASYSIPGLFQSKWLTHMRLDIDENDSTSTSSYLDLSKNVELQFSDEAENKHSSLGVQQHHMKSSSLIKNCKPSLGILCSPQDYVKLYVKHFSKYQLIDKTSDQKQIRGNLQLQSEFAHMLGFSTFLKSEAAFSWSLALRNLFTCEMRVSTGYTRLFDTALKRSCELPLPERFFFGGYCGSSRSLPGFGTNQAGPAMLCRSFDHTKPLQPTTRTIAQDGFIYDYLGGSTYLLSQLILSKKFSITKLQPLKPSLFMLGSFGLMGNSFSRTFVQNPMNHMRAAAGIGLSIPLSDKNLLEIIAVQPIKSMRSDVTRSLQFGIRLKS